jgi:homoprotocatechuate degradation regulator HpaR
MPAGRGSTQVYPENCCMSPAALRHRNLPLLLLQAREALMAQFRPLLNAEGVTEQQWRIIRSLGEAEDAGFGPLEPRQLCELCSISSPSIAGVLARMEEVGLVRRERMDSDQRRVRVSLTAASRAIATRIAPQAEARYSALETAIGVEVMQQVYDTLDRLLGHLADADSPASDNGTN